MSDTVEPRAPARTPAAQRDADIENYWRQVAAASVREKRAAKWHIREAQAAERRDRTQRLGF
jgi:hypothetical protein